MTKSMESNWCKSVEMRGEMPRVIESSQLFGKERKPVLPLFDSTDVVIGAVWHDTKYYQDKNGNLRRKDGKKIQKNKYR